MTREWKLQWVVEEEDDVIVGAETDCGQFWLEGRYVEGDKPSYFVLHSKSGVQKTVDSYAAGKRLADEWLAKPPLTREQEIEKALCSVSQYKSMAEARAKRLGLEMIVLGEREFGFRRK